MDEIKPVNLESADLSSYKKQLADCVVLTHDGKLYMQRRPESWGKHGGVVNIFGGHVEEGETAMNGRHQKRFARKLNLSTKKFMLSFSMTSAYYSRNPS